MSFSSNSSCYGSQIPSERENVPMSNDHQLLSGNLNHVQWSEDDIANVMAILTNGEAFREVRAQLDALSIDTEDPLPMSNEHEPLSGGSNIAQLSDQEMANLVAAMEVYETSYKPCAESNSLSVDTENTLSMSNEHEPLPGGSNDVQWSEQNVTKLVAAMQSGVSSPEMRALVQAFYDDTDDFLRNIDDTLLAGPADAHVDRSQHCTTSAKRKSCHTIQFVDTSSIPKRHKRRRLNADAT